jgi:hypothetical protein
LGLNRVADGRLHKTAEEGSDSAVNAFLTYLLSSSSNSTFTLLGDDNTSIFESDESG